MSAKPTITKDELVNLLKAAHRAYQGQTKPPQSTDDSWVEWYANFIIEKLQPAQSAAPPAPSASPATQAPPEPATASPPEVPRPSTAKLPERPPASSTAKTEVRAAIPTTDKLEDRAEAKPAAESPALQVCPTCAHRNRPGVYFCENCGTNLITGQQAAAGTRDLREAQDIAASSVKEAMTDAEPKQQPTIQLEKDVEKAVRSAGSSTFTPGMLLRIEVEGGSTPIIIKPKAEDMILGRRDPTTGATPEVDLTAYAGYRMGVSRRHASLALENNQISLWDLGSSNGTYLNGNKLTPHQPSPVRDGDEVRLGQMVLRLFFQNTPNSKSS